MKASMRKKRRFRVLAIVLILLILAALSMTGLCAILGKEPFSWFQYARVSVEGVYGYLSCNISASLSHREDHIQDISFPDSTLVSPPVILQTIDDAIDVDAACAQYAIFILTDSLTVVDGGGNAMGTLSEALSAVDNSVIPCFRISSLNAADALCERLDLEKWTDSFVISDNPEILRRCAENAPEIGRVYEAGAESVDAAYVQALQAKAQAVILSDDMMNEERADYFHSRSFFCWTILKDESVVDVAQAVFFGADGIISKNPALISNYLSSFSGVPVLRMKPTVVAHRGVSHNMAYAENTVSAASAALDLDVDVIEGDLSLTADGELVMFHDEAIDRLLEGKGIVSDYTLGQLQAIPMRGDAFEHVLSAEEYMSALLEKYSGRDIVFTFELKDGASDASLLAMQALFDAHPEYRAHVIINTYSKRDTVRAALNDIGIRGHMVGEVLPTGWVNDASLANILSITRTESIWWTRLTDGVPWYFFDQINEDYISLLRARCVSLLIGWQDDTETIARDVFRGVSLFSGNVPMLNGLAWGLSAPDIECEVGSAEPVRITVKAFLSDEPVDIVPDGCVVIDGQECGLSWDGAALTAAKAGDAALQWYYDTSYYGTAYRVYSPPIRVTVCGPDAAIGKD